MDPAREKRKEEINSALIFIQSSLVFPEHESYQDFLTKLVCNLLEEGNAFFKDRQWEEAVREFTEGLNVSSYAEEEEIQIPEALLESLYVNRATAYHSMGEYDRGVQDCDSALEVCKESRKALYRKALCLKELGKYKDAYSCTTNCLRITPLDKQVNELAQELAVHLGLKIRKPYVSTKLSGNHLGNGKSQTPLSGIVPVNSLRMPQSSFPSPPPSQSRPAVTVTPEKTEALEDSELMGDDLDSLLDGFPTEQGPTETHVQAVFAVPTIPSSYTHPAPSALPAPTPQLPPAFFSSAISQLNSLDSFSSGGHATSAATLDILDDLSTSGNGAGEDLGKTSKVPEALNGLDSLDSLDDFSDVTVSAPVAEEVNGSETELDTGEKSLDELLDELDVLEAASDTNGHSGVAPNISINALEQLDTLDALDLFSSVEGAGVTLPAVSIGGTGLDSLSDFSLTGIPDSHGAAAPVMRSPKYHSKKRDNQELTGIWNPLSSTHEFLPACSACFLWEEVQNLGFCKYGENCTFAYNQLEIDVWTEETKGTLDRNLLFETPAVQQDPVISIIRLLQENKGMFIFLCQECYDSKPTIISRRSRDNQPFCSNLHVRHNFDANKCLAFVVSTHCVTYRKVRPLSIMCRLELCRKAVQYGCQREDNCPSAHSVIELKTWRVQHDTGLTPEEIVKISLKFYDKQEQKSTKHKGNKLSSGASGGKTKAAAGGGGAGKNLPMRMKFVCAQCWRDGVITEPDRNLKYCTAKARHTWCKERPVLMVKSTERSKWVLVRPLPHAKNFPLYYDICTQILEKRKCNYSGNCTFAHSQEEREMWMYMKNNDLRDMQQMYDMWLTLTTHNRQVDGATQSAPEEKCIVMPTDFAEPMSGFHCRLCGRHSNSERQWQQHISTEKHKDRVFSCEGEDEALTWSYRFPGTRFKLCPKLDGSCPDGVSCDFAHSPEELQEWTERRDFLRQKLAKAREDMLIMPDEFDFGKYNFLLQD